MPEIILPCPNCQTSLLVDEQNAGQDVLCPGCEMRLTLPRDLTGAVLPVLRNTAPVAIPTVVPPVAAPAANPPSKRNHPLFRTGHMAALPEDQAPPAATGLPHLAPGHLPERRPLSAEEELRRLAALTAEPAAYDLHNVDTRGRTAFPCPGCHRPVWMTRAEWGTVTVCEGCGQEVVAPDPGKNEPARVLHPDVPAPRPKTVLPGRRQVENLPLGEQAAAGRPKRQGGQLPPAREPTPDPAPHVVDRARIPLTGIEPIPARGDVEMAATVRRGPSTVNRVVTPTQEQSAAAAEFENHALPPDDGASEPVQARIVHRINPERLPNFTPKHDADLSPETSGQWGGTAPQEHSVAFRRTLTMAIITLLLGGIGVTAFLLRATFAPHDPGGEVAADDSPVQSVDDAKRVLLAVFAAQSVEEMAKYVRHPEITLPRMKAWYAAGIPQQTVEFTANWVEQDNYLKKGVNFIFTAINTGDGKMVDVALEIPKDGSAPRLDWEHFAAWSATPWSEFLKTTSERPADFRVTITPIDYYNAHYSDRQRYLAFRVSDRANFGSCYAYCEAGSSLGKLLLKSVREARQRGEVGPVDPATEIAEGVARVILRLRFLPEGQKFNQASIDALVWDDWLEP